MLAVEEALPIVPAVMGAMPAAKTESLVPQRGGRTAAYSQLFRTRSRVRFCTAASKYRLLRRMS